MPEVLLGEMTGRIASENPAVAPGLIRRCVEAGYRLASLERVRRKQAPEVLDEMIYDFREAIAAITARLEAGKLTVEEWRTTFEALIARYHATALMVGIGDTLLDEARSEFLVQAVATQFGYLEDFSLEIVSEAEWAEAFTARAEMYAGAIGEPYWSGETQFLPLPAMPRDGTTQCLTNCGCEWEIIEVDPANGDFDAYWRRSKDDSCQTCLEREAQWSPVQIRGWRLL